MSYWRIISELPLLPVFFELNLSVEPNNNNQQKLMSPQEHMNKYKFSVPLFAFHFMFYQLQLIICFFFSILNFAYFIKKVKQIHCKLWLVKRKVEHKNLWCTKAAKWAPHLHPTRWRADSPFFFRFVPIRLWFRPKSNETGRNWPEPAEIYWNLLISWLKYM